ncbi:unnamed protein product [Rotaria sp. Silwood1]|nr:unnamed protein product [Rotaria sp. Silwood1]
MCKLRYFIVIEGQRAKFRFVITGQPNSRILTLTIEDWSQEAAGEIIIIVENRADLMQCSAVLTAERNHAQSCSYAVKLRGSITYSWLKYASSSSG